MPREPVTVWLVEMFTTESRSPEATSATDSGPFAWAGPVASKAASLSAICV